MPRKKYSDKTIARAKELRYRGESWSSIGRQMDIPDSTIKQWALNDGGWPVALVERSGGGQMSDLKKTILSLTEGQPKRPIMDLVVMADAPFSEIEKAVHELQGMGYDIDLDTDSVDRKLVPDKGSEVHLFERVKKARYFKIGLLGDNQLGNMASRLDVLNAAYDHFEAEGITHVYHTGNMIDGFRKRINFNELLPEAGFDLDSQTEYAAQVYPKKEGIVTHFITGECHEGWWYKDFGINVGRFMDERFQSMERGDLQYVGHLEADIQLRIPDLRDGVRGPILRLMHPGGGTAYALSYKSQKIAESLQGGEKPQIQAIGHFHKFDWNYHREIQNIMTGTTCDQTVFMRKLNIPAHVGYLIAELKVNPDDGVLESFKVEWIPWYDRGFYSQWTR